MTSESFWNYFRDDVDNANDNASDSKSFKYKIKITGKTEVKPAQVGNGGDTNRLPRNPVPSSHVEFTIPPKYLGSFWKSLGLSLINCEVELDLAWLNWFVLLEYHNYLRIIFQYYYHQALCPSSHFDFITLDF